MLYLLCHINFYKFTNKTSEILVHYSQLEASKHVRKYNSPSNLLSLLYLATYVGK